MYIFYISIVVVKMFLIIKLKPCQICSLFDNMYIQRMDRINNGSVYVELYTYIIQKWIKSL